MIRRWWWDDDRNGDGDWNGDGDPTGDDQTVIVDWNNYFLEGNDESRLRGKHSNCVKKNYATEKKKKKIL